MPLTKTKAIPVLKSIIWDYDVSPGELYEVITGQRPKAGPFNFDRLFVRMLERLSWYELIDLLGMDYIKEHLTPDIIGKIRFKTLRGRYETVRKLLSGNPVSFSGWHPEYREEIKHTLLSNRWYRTHFDEHSKTMGRIDSWRNILSNKLAAAFRYEAKDFADIWIIAKYKPIAWREIITEAKTKEAGIDPLALQEILRTFPSDEVMAVKWSIPIDQKEFITDLATIADDILQGKENSLFRP